jgi:hypothetical protein
MDETLRTDPVSTMPRRRFLAAAPLLLTVPLLPRLAGRIQEKELARSPERSFAAEEWERIQSSIMARDMDNYFGKGYSCAESLLMTALRRMRQPENLVWAAAGYGGGMRQKDLCGFLTAGFMAIGLAAGQLKLERKEAKARSTEIARAYWEWWRESSPLHCAEIRTPEADRETCRRLGMRAAARLEDFLGRIAPLPG